MNKVKRQKKRIGLLIDSVNVSKQINDLIRLSASSKNYEITTLIINEIDNSLTNPFTKSFSYSSPKKLFNL